MQNITSAETIGVLRSISRCRIMLQITEKVSVSDQYVKWQGYMLSGRKKNIIRKKRKVTERVQSPPKDEQVARKV